jgi:hypothetical protein
MKIYFGQLFAFLRFYLPCKPVLTLNSLGGLSDFAELSSRYKASHVKLMLWWVSRKCCEVADANPEDIDLQVLATCTWALQRCTEIQSEAGIVLTESEANESSRCLFTYNRSYAWLALRFEGVDFLFKVRPKNHYLEHMAFSLKELRLNQCKLFATHTDESFLGRIKSIACQVHGKTLTKRVFQRYILCLAVSMDRLKKTRLED